MARSRIVEVSFHDFMTQLRRAAEAGGRIEQSATDAWNAYIKENGVKEASCLSVARSKSENVQAVIISGGDWDGYYVYSQDDQVCLKFERG